MKIWYVHAPTKTNYIVHFSDSFYDCEKYMTEAKSCNEEKNKKGENNLKNDLLDDWRVFLDHDHRKSHHWIFKQQKMDRDPVA